MKVTVWYDVNGSVIGPQDLVAPYITTQQWQQRNCDNVQAMIIGYRRKGGRKLWALDLSKVYSIHLELDAK